MKYLIKFFPLESYSFGTEQGFEYPNEKKTGKESYFVTSKDEPEQTMVLGVLRYLLLKHNDLLKTDFRYDSERDRMDEVIGKQSFSFDELEKQSFGQIKEISPIFILNEHNDILIRNPFNNVAENGYIPMKMTTEIETIYGHISMPDKDEYNSKQGYARGYYNLSTGNIVTDMFKTVVAVGNRKNGEEVQDKKDGFFKRELKNFVNEGYSFALYADIMGEFPMETVAYMGKNKSAFVVKAEQIIDCQVSASDILAKQVENAFKDSKEIWYYALSDIIVRNDIRYSNFCIIEDKKQRNLQTNHNSKGYLGKIKKSEVLYNLISRGSVFYKDKPAVQDDNAEQIGYNKIVRLGGN